LEAILEICALVAESGLDLRKEGGVQLRRNEGATARVSNRRRDVRITGGLELWPPINNSAWNDSFFEGEGAVVQRRTSNKRELMGE
jgi:hypothetical protein